MKVGDTVVMKGSVIKRSRHSEFARNFIGEVLSVQHGTCDVKTIDGVVVVPTANLSRKRGSLIIEVCS